jgi:hypothetical protein
LTQISSNRLTPKNGVFSVLLFVLGENVKNVYKYHICHICCDVCHGGSRSKQLLRPISHSFPVKTHATKKEKCTRKWKAPLKARKRIKRWQKC